LSRLSEKQYLGSARSVKKLSIHCPLQPKRRICAWQLRDQAAINATAGQFPTNLLNPPIYREVNPGTRQSS
jgi:hypothetical protein